MFYTSRRVPGEEAVPHGPRRRAGAAGRGALRRAEARRGDRRAAPLGVLETRATMRAGLADRVRAATDIELEKQTRLRKTADFKEGVDAINQRRLPKFAGR